MMDNYCKYVYFGAAHSGNLSLFKSMKSQGYPFSRKACTIAAENGHLNIIQWILSEIEVWEEFYEETYRDWLDNVISPAAAGKGHLNILKIMPETTTWNTAVNAALQNGQMEILKWLQEKNYIEADENYFVSAASSGNLDIMKWLRNEYDFELNWVGALQEAVKIGNLDIIDDLTENVEFDYQCCSLAAKFGHFEVIKWMVENKYEWNSDTTTSAAEYGDLSILLWLLDKKFPVNKQKLAKGAIKGGNLQLIEWLDVNLNIKWTDPELCSIAVSISRWDILKWLFEKKCQVNNGIVAEAIIKGASLDILKKLHSEEPEPNWDSMSETAGSYERFDFIEWLSNEIDTNVCETAWTRSFYGAMKKNRFDFMKKAYSNYCVCLEKLPRFLVAPPLYEWLRKQECVK